MKILLLAGTSEALELAQSLARHGHGVTASFARAPREIPAGICSRIGGFGGVAGFHAALDELSPDLVIDATHPFATAISTRTAQACADRGLARITLQRPAWRPGPRDRWIAIREIAETRAHIPPGATIFVATGRDGLSEFACLPDCTLICRRLGAPDAPFPLPNGYFLEGNPPFSPQEEIALFERLGIDWLVVRNAGGQASRSKLDAAAALGLPVAMLSRPAPPPGPVLEQVADVLEWMAAHADH